MQPSSVGLIAVGVIAIAALAFSAYVALEHNPAPANTSSGQIPVTNVDVERRLATVEQRLATLEQRHSTLEKERPASPTPAGDGRAPTAAPAALPQSVAATAVASTPVSRHDTGAGLFELVPNAELKGRLGRLVVEFPKGNELKARTEVFKAGDAKGLRTDFDNVAVEMTAGIYDLNIGGAIVTNVTINSGHDTRVHVGVLRLNATGNTRFELFPPGEKKSLGTYFGQTDVGLPVGTYEVEVNSQRERVTIPSGGIAEF